VWTAVLRGLAAIARDGRKHIMGKLVCRPRHDQLRGRRHGRRQSAGASSRWKRPTAIRILGARDVTPGWPGQVESRARFS